MITAGWVLSPLHWFGWDHSDRRLKVEELSNCRTRIGAARHEGLVSLLEDLTREGRAEVPSRRHCAKHSPARHTAWSSPFPTAPSLSFLPSYPSDYHFDLSNPTSAVEHPTGSRLSLQPKWPVSSKLKGQQDLTSWHQAGVRNIISALQIGKAYTMLSRVYLSIS